MPVAVLISWLSSLFNSYIINRKYRISMIVHSFVTDFLYKVHFVILKIGN